MPALTTPAAEPDPVASAPERSSDAEPAADAEQWRAALRHFHLTTEPTGPLVDAPPARAALPESLLEPEALLRGWPLVLPEVTVNGAPAEILPLGEVVQSAIGELGGRSMLVGQAGRLVLAFDAALDGSDGIVPFGEVAERALEAFRADFDLSDAAATSFDEELHALSEQLPADAHLLGLSPS